MMGKALGQSHGLQPDFKATKLGPFCSMFYSLVHDSPYAESRCRHKSISVHYCTVHSIAWQKIKCQMQKIKAHSSELIWKIKTYFSKIKSENDIFLVKKDIFLVLTEGFSLQWFDYHCHWKLEKRFTKFNKNQSVRHWCILLCTASRLLGTHGLSLEYKPLYSYFRWGFASERWRFKRKKCIGGIRKIVSEKDL